MSEGSSIANHSHAGGKPPPEVMRSLFWLGIPSLVAVCIYALSPGAMFGTALVTATASFAVGALLGFLFGIPRSLAGERNPGGAQKGLDQGRPRVEPNTNLEQISDWLTKILVGVSLVQFEQIGDAIGSVAAAVGPTLAGDDQTGEAVAVAVMVSFAVTGFLSAYLFTRLRLQGAFALAGVIEAVVEEKADAENKALAMVRSQLDAGDDGPSQDDLNAALAEASRATRAQAFFIARDQRRANWEDGDKKLLELTMPIFKALIACDRKNRYHRNHAELGYALKDKENPDHAAAKESLSRAIEMRGSKATGPFALYEFNRAVCEIALDPTTGREEPSPQPVVDRVAPDLEVAAGSRLGRNAIAGEQSVQTWLSRNAGEARVAALQERIAALSAG